MADFFFPWDGDVTAKSALHGFLSSLFFSFPFLFLLLCSLFLCW